MSTLSELSPPEIWQHFQDLNAIPRPSKHEQRAVAFIETFGRGLGLATEVDAAGNVVIRKPASPGREGRAPVALQSHLDMVCQKNADTDFDFATQGIRMCVEGDWVRAEGTTLGADNGIGVAAVMAVLASDELAHPPLEALFTVDEETGMTGAKALQPGVLTAHTLLNLDSEDDRELTIGCAGGIDVVAEGSVEREATPPGWVGRRLMVSGLTGGHSGMDIHRGRANANKLLVRGLLELVHEFGVRLVAVDGGGLRNAIPREAQATVLVDASREADLQAWTARTEALWQVEYATTDPGLRLSLSEHSGGSSALTEAFQHRWLRCLHGLLNGIHRLSPDVPGLVQTSNNLARVVIEGERFKVGCLTRGSVDSEKHDLARSVAGLLEVAGARVELVGDYPGWQPRPEARVVALMRDAYRDLCDAEPVVTACHAGLECGILGTNYPDLEMISFGPNIHGAHSPEERVQISSVQKFWRLLTETLSRL